LINERERHAGSRAAHCAGDQGKFWDMHDALFNKPAETGLSDLTDRADTLKLAFGAPELPEMAGAGNAGNLRGVYERAGFRFPALPHAREELREIARAFPADKTKVLVSAEASGVAVKSAKLADYKRLHFATHTIFDERSPRANRDCAHTCRERRWNPARARYFEAASGCGYRGALGMPERAGEAGAG
jgi:hypothetical protein